jgi:hypothetical protein
MKTALLRLIEQLEGEDSKIARVIGLKKYNSIIKEALQEEKEQIKDAYLNGRYEADKIVMGHSFYAKQYYNETFKQQ